MSKEIMYTNTVVEDMNSKLFTKPVLNSQKLCCVDEIRMMFVKFQKDLQL